MRNPALALATWAIFAAGEAFAQTPQVITQPDWAERPSAEDLAEAYPELANALEIEGYAVIDCSVSQEGGLSDCRIATQAPKDLGFGKAAVAMSSQFRMRPQTLNGRPVAGGIVRIPIRFRLPGEEPAAPPAAGPEAIKQGLRLVDALQMMAVVDRFYDDKARQLEFTPEDGVPQEARDLAADLLRKAVKARLEDHRRAYAQALASVFSAEEMAAIADYAASPAGKLLQPNEMETAEQRLVSQEVQRAWLAGAHDAYCAAHPCGGGAETLRVWRAVPGKDRLDNPQWAQAPSQEVIDLVRPALAAMLGQTGAVRLTCRLQDTSALGDCVADEESPAGFGFAEAALQLVDGYRLSPLQASAPAVGKKVTVRIGFSPMAMPEGYAGPAAPSPARLALAREMVARSGLADTLRAELDSTAEALRKARPKTADAKLYDAGVEALRKAGTTAIERRLDMQARSVASHLSESELRAAIAFADTPAGRAFRQRQDAVQVATQKAGGYVGEKVLADARGAFCKIRDCEVPQAHAAAKPDASTRKP